MSSKLGEIYVGLTQQGAPIHSVFSPPVSGALGAVSTTILGGEGITLKMQSDTERKLNEQIKEMQEKMKVMASENRDAKVRLTEARLLQSKYDLMYILSCIDQQHHQAFVESEKNQSLFKDGSTSESFVISIDIRRSTDLMLKAKSAKDFSGFISELCTKLCDVIKTKGGVFDKFTGDGILASFPVSYSGPDAGLKCLSAAKECHRVYRDIFHQYRSSFDCIPLDSGLGIGVDFGTVTYVRIPESLTVVGKPVVYACRLGGCPAFKTAINQGAYDKICRNGKASLLATEGSVTFKHDGEMLCYFCELQNEPNEYAIPEWQLPAVTQ